MKLKLTFLALAMHFFAFSAISQTVSGTVNDSETGDPIIGAYVIELGTTNGVTTDADGKFSFSLNGISTEIEISYLGYKSTIISVSSEILNINLVPDLLALDDVVVSANRVDENLQKVSVAATVLGEKELRDMSAQRSVETLITVPNVITDSYGPSLTNVSIRGISTNFDGVGLEQAVGMYVNDVYLSRAYSFNSMIMDVERVEVLRGPQGTLFGKNTVGGVINVKSAQPGMYNEGAVELSVGNFNYLQAKAMANLELVDEKLALRVSGAYNTRKASYVNHTSEAGQAANKTEFVGLRGSLLFKPSPIVDITIDGYFGKDNSAEATMTYLSSPDLIAFDPILFAPDDWENRETSFSEPFTFQREMSGGSAKIQAALGTNTLTSITAYNGSTDQSIQDVELSAIPAVYLDRTQEFGTFTQELRLNSAQNRKFTYVTGLYFVNENIRGNDIGVTQEFLPPLVGPDLGIDDLFIPGYTEQVNNQSQIENNSFALFGSFGYKFTPKFKVDAGLRYTIESKSFTTQQTTVESQDAIDIVGLPIVYLLGTPYEPATFTAKDNVLTGDLAFTYNVNDNNLLYAKFARGFKGTGYNFAVASYLNLTTFSIDPITEANVLYKPEFINSYEIGVKSSPSDRLRINAAAYYIDYENKQELLFAGLTNFIANAERSTGFGGEVELSAILAKGFRVNVNGGIQQMKYDKFVFGSEDLSNNFLAKAPRGTFSFAPIYTAEFKNNSRLLARVDVNYTGKSFNDIYNTESISRDAVTLVNARLGYSLKSDRYSVSIWGKNLTNQLFFGHGFVGLIGDFVSINQATTYGVDLRFNISN